MEQSNVRKEIMESLNVIKIGSYVMLGLSNVTMELSNMSKKIKEPLNVKNCNQL